MNHRTSRTPRGPPPEAANTLEMFPALQKLLQRFRAPEPVPQRLALSDTGVTLWEGDREIYRFSWSDVSKIETYKRDLLTVDLICLDFSVEKDQQIYVVHDEMHGFSELSGQLIQRFPSIPPDWWSAVALPAFATNYRVLYEQSRIKSADTSVN